MNNKIHGKNQFIVGGRLTRVLFLALIGISTADQRLSAQLSIAYGNNAGGIVDIVNKIDLFTGDNLQTYTPSGGNGRGVVVVGNIIYSTEAIGPQIYKTDATTGASLGYILTEQASMSTLAWDGSTFWTTDYDGSNRGRQIDLSGTTIKTVTFSESEGNMDGLEYFNGKLIVNHHDGGEGGPNSYSIYDLNGNLLAKDFITAPNGTGIAYNGVNFVVSDIRGNAINEYDGTDGHLIGTLPLVDFHQIEDLSVDYAQRSDTDGSFKLTPASADNAVGTTHTVTATLLDLSPGGGVSIPIPGATVTFAVTAGSNVGETGTGVTDANGQATFTYADLGGIGTDTIIAMVDANGVTKIANAIKNWVPLCAYDLSVEVGYEFGGTGDSFLYTSDPDSGFVIIKNNGLATFVGELRLDGVAGSGGDVHDTSGPGYILAPGQSFRLEAGPNSSDQGGFNKVTNVCSVGCNTPDNGLLLSINGTADGYSLNFQVYDKDIHSGVPQVNPYGVRLDNYILQGGDPCGRDTGEDFEVNQTHATFHVRGSCVQPCKLICPGDITVCNQKGQCGSVVNFAEPRLSGDCVEARLTCSPASGSFFPIGITPVLCTATAGGRVVAECSFNITVLGNEPPIITCPANITKGNDHGRCGALVFFSPTVQSCSSNVAVTISPPSGTLFPVGTTTVNCRTGDSNAPSCSFTITVRDTEPPRLTCPTNITITKDSDQCGAVVTFSPSATDNCPGVTNVSSPASGSFFPVGTTTVTTTATDKSGNVADCRFEVTVLGTICATMFYDANVNGTQDIGEPGISGWKIVLTDSSTNSTTVFTGSNGTVCVNVPAGTYTVTEVPPTGRWWNTRPTSCQVTVSPAACDQSCSFGNACTNAPANGLTLGFWSNKNGENILAANPGWVSLLNGLGCLRNANGSLHTFSNYADLKNWLLKGTAVNMAYMLSVQLATSILNEAYNGQSGSMGVVIPGGVNASTNVCIVSFLTVNQAITCGSPALLSPTVFPGSTTCGCTSNDGFVTIANLRARACCLLGTYNNTVAANTQRSYEECVKDLLDMINNNGNPPPPSSYPCGPLLLTISPTPASCPFTYPY